MPKQAFIDKNLSDQKLALIVLANEIIDDYRAQGFVLTLRQLYYQFVARDLIENTVRSYKRLGDAINDGRLCGFIDWEAIEDRTRALSQWAHEEDPKSAIQRCRDGYDIDRWTNQDYRVEVWIEKEALAGVIEGICGRLDVPFFACRGYVSQSEQWRAGLRIHQRMLHHKQQTVIIHLGDHDPSGIDMTRDNDERLDMFAYLPTDESPIVQRIALNWDQIEEFEPPPNPAKTTDSRYAKYVREFGNESWELDALEPRTLTRLIEEEVDQWRDMGAWEERERQVQADRSKLLDIILELEDDDDSDD